MNSKLFYLAVNLPEGGSQPLAELGSFRRAKRRFAVNRLHPHVRGAHRQTPN